MAPPLCAVRVLLGRVDVGGRGWTWVERVEWFGLSDASPSASGATLPPTALWLKQPLSAPIRPYSPLSAHYPPLSATIRPCPPLP